MPLKSLFPDLSPLPDVNVHYFTLKRPDQAAWPDYTIHIDSVSGERRKFNEFVSRVRDLATAVGAPIAQGGLGLRAEDNVIVGIMSENCMDYVTLVHSCLAIATPFALISSFSTRFELKHSLKLSKTTHLFVDAKLLPVVISVTQEVGFPLENIYLLIGKEGGRKSVSDLVNDARIIPQIPIRPAKKDTLAYLVFSSGTSGLPKAVKISHGNIIYSMAQSMVVGQERARVYTPPPLSTPEGIPVGLGFLPIHHTFGLHMSCFRAFLLPGTQVIIPRWNVEKIIEAIPKYKVTSLHMVPSMVHQLVNHPMIRNVDFSSVLGLYSGAAYLPPSLASKLSRLAPPGAQVADGYGMSECTVSAIVHPFPGILGGMKAPSGCTGILLPGMQARIVRDDGTDANFNEPGELWMKGGNIALGYWNNEKADKETFVDGWLHSGDRFRVDKHGYFYFADRAKDTLKVSGSQVSPAEIEDVLLAHPKKLILDVAVAGVSGGRTSDEKVPRAWVVLGDTGRRLGHPDVLRELEQWYQSSLSKYKWLRGGIEIVDAIPKSPTGKVLRRVLQEDYESKREHLRGKL